MFLACKANFLWKFSRWVGNLKQKIKSSKLISKKVNRKYKSSLKNIKIRLKHKNKLEKASKKNSLLILQKCLNLIKKCGLLQHKTKRWQGADRLISKGPGCRSDLWRSQRKRIFNCQKRYCGTESLALYDHARSFWYHAFAERIQHVVSLSADLVRAKKPCAHF